MEHPSEITLQNLSKEELIEHVQKLNAHVKQLKNIIKKGNFKEILNETNDQSSLTSSNKDSNKKERKFDYSKYNRRHIALKFFYLGWDYEGYVSQEDTACTIEHAIFEALLKTKLIQNRSTCNYHRSGRTDKGVSAFSQVISLDVRSCAESGKGVQQIEGSKASNLKDEVNYCKILNKSLPKEIKFYAWAEVDFDFSARFDCTKRTYRYFFPAGSLDIDAMRIAASQLEGVHDFRNFCKLDRTKLDNTFVRNIYNTKIVVAENFDSSNSISTNEKTIYVLEIIGKAFLWHQIRCIVAILFMVGEGKESPQIVSDLLNVEMYPKKPQYPLASELPLVLYECDYSEGIDHWNYDAEAIEDAMQSLRSLWNTMSIKNAIICSIMNDLNSFPIQGSMSMPSLQTFILPLLKSNKYKKICDQPVSETHLSSEGEDRLRKNIKHRKISKFLENEKSDEKRIKLK